MKKFLALKVNQNEIVLANSNDLEELYTIMDNNENFILQWPDGTEIKSEVMIANDLIGKVKSGSFTLTAREQKTQNGVRK